MHSNLNSESIRSRSYIENLCFGYNMGLWPQDDQSYIV